MTFSCCVFESILLQYFESNFEDLLAFRVPIGLQMGLWGHFWCQISAHFVTLVASWFQSGSKAPKRSHFGSLWGVF